MQRLCHARFLARLVLAWFALAIGIAVAAPMVGASSLELVCSGSGALKLVARSQDGSTQPAGHGLDCPLCVTIDAPPPAARLEAIARPASPGPRQFLGSTRIAARTAAPPPGRGPPAQA